MFYIYDTDGTLKITQEGDAQDFAFLIGLIVNEGLNDEYTVGKIVDKDGNETIPENEFRRKERTLEFAETIDKLNPIWFDTLTTEQQNDLRTWRQSWLNYPSDLTTNKPARPEGIF